MDISKITLPTRLAAVIPVGILVFGWFTYQALNETPLEMILALSLFLWVVLTMAAGCYRVFNLLWHFSRHERAQKILQSPDLEEKLKTMSQQEIYTLAQATSFQIDRLDAKISEKESKQAHKERTIKNIIQGESLLEQAKTNIPH